MSYVSEAGSKNTANTTRLFARLIAVLVVFIMVSTAFVAVLSRAEGAPEIWTSKDEYSPGETVEIYGGGFVKWVPVTITISHPDLIEKSFVVTPDLYGRFVCNDYTAELVSSYLTPVTVTATQTLDTGNVVATTQFYDPAAYIEGWTLMPHQRWTTGDVKGYNEGDSVPMMVVVNKKQIHGSNTVTMSIGVDMFNKTPSEAYGIDYLTQYWLNPPSPPFNTYTNSSEPFFVLASEGSLSGVHRDANIYDEGRKLTEQVWSFTFTFATGATTAMIRFGAHLAITDLANGIKGASYWPGESLHVRIVAMSPDVNNGNRDVPISVKETTGPPEMVLIKECDPEVVLEGDIITFTVHWMNTGEAPAYCVRLWDELPWSVDLLPGTFLYWDSTNPTPMTPIPGPEVTSTGWQWDIGLVPGAPFEAWLSFEAVVITSEPGWYENWVYLTFTDSHGSHFPQLSAECRFYIPPPPSIMIEKSGPFYAHDGDLITYTYNVSNNGPVDLVNVDVVDDVVGTIATGLSLTAGSWIILTGDYVVQPSDPHLLVNIVKATGEDQYGRQVSDEATWTVIIFRPHIEVEKQVNVACAKAGETVWYTISWYNPPEWETTLYNVTLIDSLLGEFSIGTLQPGQGGEMTEPYVVTNDWDPLVNTVGIQGEDWIHGIATDTDEARVDVVHPAVQITKTANKACGLPGEAITYTITVTNPGYADVWLNGSYGDTVLKLTWTFENLKPGQSVSQIIDTTLPDVDPFENAAWVIALDHQQHMVEATASVTVDVVHPHVEITKTVDVKCGAVGEVVTFTITVSNPSTADVWLNGTVFDPLLGMEESFTNLKPGESKAFVVPYTLPEGPTEVINTAWVDAYDHQLHLVTARTGEIRVDIVHPDVEITKSSSMACAAVGEDITWTIVVTNPVSADVWLNGTVEDAVLGQSWQFFNLMPGESAEFKYTQAMPDGPTEIINTATVTATDHQGHVVSATSEPVRVDIVHPAVEITKTSSLPCAGVGELITWTITVTNPASADVWLNGTITDPALDMSWTFENLMPGDSVVVTVGQNMPDVPYFDNWAYVTATDHQKHTVRGAAEAIVDVVHPDVEIEKSVSMPCGAVGEEVIWKIVVLNPGSADVWLNGTVDDPVLGMSWDFTNLMPGQTAVFTQAQILPEGPTDIINIATVSAKDHQGHVVTATSEPVRVDIVHPAIEITKTASLPCAAVGEEVTFTVTVTNPATADVWLNGTISDPMLGKSWPFINLKPGEDIVKTVTIPMPEGPTEFINTAYVTAFDHQDHEVSGSASVRVDIVHPDIEITKASSMPCAAVGEDITWTISVTNPLTADVWLNGTVTDPLLQQSWPFTNLKPGETFTVKYTQSMPEGPTELINVAYVVAEDHQLHTIRAQSEPVRVDIVHPDVEIEKTADRYLAHVGDTINYAITVTNPITADVMLNGTVTDSMFGVIGTFSYLAPGESITWFPTHTVVIGDPDVITNTASVTAKDHQEHEVTDEDSWTVTILRPDIHVTKIGPVWANVGDVITYYVNVTNIGTCDLFNVSVTDTLAGELGPIPVLLVGETVHLTYQWTVPAGPGTLDNTVTARGEDRLHLFVEDRASWTVNKFVVIKGLKAADYNANGVWDDGEPGLMNWLILLEGVDVDGGVVSETTLTDSLGNYAFTGLKAGDYTVSEFLLAGWHNFSPLSYSLTLDSGSLAIRDFLNMPFGSISGYKFQDENLNGVWDDGEPGIAGWTIFLEGTTIGGLTVDTSTTTGPGGLYAFTDLMPGLYFVSEESRLGWFATTPSPLVVDAGSLDPFVVTDQNFGNVELGGITGFKWLDENMNGYEDGIEPFLPGWTIILDGTQTDGTHVHMETITGPSGYYAFLGLLPGVYTVTEVLQDGWLNITPLSREITIVPGSIVTCAKFGNVPLGCIQGWKFLDWDMDGMKDGNEPGIQGWKITLTGWLADGTPSFDEDNATHIVPIVVYTNETGGWKFCGLLPGVYFVTEESRENWYHTTPLTRHFEIRGWHAEGLCIIPGATHVIDVKFGNVPYTCLWGYKWNDLNGDGQHQDNEPGIEGWTVHVVGVRNDGVPVDLTLTTDQNGLWQTCFNILPGTYRIYEELQNGWTPTSPESFTVTIPMSIEPVKHQYNFMNFQNGKIKGYKYEDMNGDHLLDAGDVPLMNWVVFLEDSSHTVIATKLTAADGSFEFTGLPFGTYYVVEQSLSGWVPMTPVSVMVDVASGTEVVLDAFLNVELSRVFGYKFDDLNGNGIKDPGEPGIGGWTIYMIWDLDPTVYTTTTDANGFYEFTNLMPDGFYMVYEEERAGWTPTNTTWEQFSLSSGTTHKVHDFMNFQNVKICVFKFNDRNGDGLYDPETDMPLEGWHFTIYGPGLPVEGVVLVTDVTGYACIVLTKAGEYTVVEEGREGWCHTTPAEQSVVITSGLARPSHVLKFGNFECVNITIFKYEDVNGNGVYEQGIDEPIEGWQFWVFNEVQDTFNLYATDENGLITLKYCKGDLVTITEVVPEGWTIVTPVGGTYEVFIVSGHAYNTADWKEQTRYEFGNFKCVKISVFKYWDRCSNGWFDPGYDVPLEGWLINVYDAAGVNVRHGHTDANGWFNFTICKAGTYTIVEENREGWSHISPASGKFVIDVVSGDVWVLRFGNYQHVKVCVFKYEDVNSNGIYDELIDRPIQGWHFDLVRTGDGLTYTAETGDDGIACFEVNRSGVYRVVEENRDGWTHINPANGMMLLDIVSGVQIPLLRFGNFHNVCIPVFKFADVDGDGYYEPAEGDVPIQGWNFTLWMLVDDSWVELDKKATNADGFLCFSVNRSGEYKVSEEAREGWIWIVPRSGEYRVTVHSGTMFECPLVFGNFKFGKITGHKYNDLNGNGIWDLGEPGLPGWTIHFMVQGPFFLMGQVDTDVNGYYEFTGLPPGIYSVWEDGQNGWVPTTPTQVTVEIRGNTHAVVDFLNFQKGCIEGYKYEDVNDNGVYDPGIDRPIQGWEITLAITTGVIHTPEGDISAIAIVGITETDETGHYQFCGLGPGLYIVSEETRPDWVPTSPTSSGIMLLHSGEKIVFIFLNFAPGSICGYKFEDKNSNGVWDDGEPAIEGWKISMIEDSLPEVRVTYTNANGYWCFDGLRSDYYIVWEESREHWTNTTVNWFNVTILSGMDVRVPSFGNFHNVCIPIFKFNDVNGDGKYEVGTDEPIEGWEFTVTGPAFPDGIKVYTNADGRVCVEVDKAGDYTVTEADVQGWMHTTDPTITVGVVSGDVVSVLMFGNFELGSIIGLKFYDRDLDGVRDQSEPGLANWVIVLEGPSGVQTQLTDSLGNYEFTGLPAGGYIVSENFALAPAGWVPTVPPIVILWIGSGDIKTVDFGNAVFGNITGVKFYDKDMDGVRDDGEPGLPGWTIKLDGVTDYGAEVHRTTVTDANGHYAFEYVQPGSYSVTEVMPGTEWIATTPLPQLRDSSGAMEKFSFVVDIGNVRFAKIWGYKFLDTYAEDYPFWPNGLFDADEFGLGNWRITLQGWTDTGVRVDEVRFTDNVHHIGLYVFENVLPGMYWVNETLLFGYYATRPISNLIMVYPFPLGPVCIRIDFGNLVPSKDPTVPFVLEKGWNLWSSPLLIKGGLTAKSLLSAIGPNGVVVTRLNATTGKYQSYGSGYPVIYDFPIVQGEGYFVFVKQKTAFSLTGELPTSGAIKVVKGWNLIGYDRLEGTTASKLVSSGQGCTVMVVTYLDAQTGEYKSFAKGYPSMYDFKVTSGRAYYLYVNAAGTLNL